MRFTFEPMTQEQAKEIAYNWHYDGEYSFYDMEADKEDLVEFLDPEKREGNYFVVVENKEIIGFFSFNRLAKNTIDIGLGMKPDLTGKGTGLEFLKEGIAFAISKYDPEKITLSVATFNQRAIKVYKKIGFMEDGTFMQHTNGDVYEFMKMYYAC